MTNPSPPAFERPLVSVLIRTTGRASLAETLRSLEAQELRDFETVIANVTGHALPALSPPLPSMPMRWLEPGTPLSRSDAANALLGAACGKYLLFLDDDDRLLPDHLAKLARTLDTHPELVAAYGDVECVSADGALPHRTIARYEREFDPVALQLQNYLPIHAVLFRAGAANASPPCRFAPELELFEDWDFWLQLATRGPFQRAPGVSAIYALDPRAGSRHGESGNALRESMLERLGARQLARWSPSCVAALVERDSASATRQRDLEQRLAAREAGIAESGRVLESRNVRIRELAAALGEAQAHSRAQQAEIDKLSQVRREMLDSLSWRVTKPMRVASRIFHAGARRVLEPFRLARNVASAVVQDIGKHGFAGFARRLPYYLRNRGMYLKRLGGAAPGSDPLQFHAKPPITRALRLHPDLEPAKPDIQATVSVVIPTLNAGVEFSWLLRKLRGQAGLAGVEIVVVDSGSTDDTVRLARAAGAKVIEIAPSEFSHSHARNLGARNASGDYLLFTVQDAYPIGERWLQGLLAFLREHEAEKVAAVSCAEYARSDSEMMYDAMIATHYRFLGCLDADRIGEFRGGDHMALRTQGQLSDVACLIARPLFERYRYRGNYAEDLDLGIRLIRDGMRVAMLSSIKAVHSHNRPAYYYLKRTFVDVIFLVGLFDDFTYPHCDSLPGLLAGVRGVAAYVSRWLATDAQADAGGLLCEQLAQWIAAARAALEAGVTPQPAALGDRRLDDFVNRAAASPVPCTLPDTTARQEARRFHDMFLGRLEHFNEFARAVYGEQDAQLRKEAADVIRKTFAAAAGAALAFYCLDHDEPAAEALRSELVAGV
ncbi:MAG TPA: glycosyltransferase [Ramlibacter sp.]|uniref:glycosyltransferase n=1 Tax=Ramlibacter sp. TaxID=1917967 RepID=UPI002B8F323A|nr:glycosyltransferase [Ramlibacter sp.]HVZ42286.1 glycosyltransferase [Ramlibacter sp.]